MSRMECELVKVADVFNSILKNETRYLNTNFKTRLVNLRRSQSVLEFVFTGEYKLTKREGTMPDFYVMKIYARSIDPLGVNKGVPTYKMYTFKYSVQISDAAGPCSEYPSGNPEVTLTTFDDLNYSQETTSKFATRKNIAYEELYLMEYPGEFSQEESAFKVGDLVAVLKEFGKQDGDANGDYLLYFNTLMTGHIEEISDLTKQAHVDGYLVQSDEKIKPKSLISYKIRFRFAGSEQTNHIVVRNRQITDPQRIAHYLC